MARLLSTQGRPIYLEYSAQTNIPGLTADGVTTEDFVFAAVRQMEYLVRIRLAACQAAAGRKLDGHVVISVSLLPCSMLAAHRAADGSNLYRLGCACIVSSSPSAVHEHMFLDTQLWLCTCRTLRARRSAFCHQRT